MDKEGWYAAVHSITKSLTWLSNWTELIVTHLYATNLWDKELTRNYHFCTDYVIKNILLWKKKVSWVKQCTWRWKVKLLSYVQIFVTPWTVDYQASSSMGFSRQKYWRGLPFPSPGDLPNSGIKSWSPPLQTGTLTSELPGKPTWWWSSFIFWCMLFIPQWVGWLLLILFFLCWLLTYTH